MQPLSLWKISLQFSDHSGGAAIDLYEFTEDASTLPDPVKSLNRLLPDVNVYMIDSITLIQQNIHMVGTDYGGLEKPNDLVWTFATALEKLT